MMAIKTDSEPLRPAEPRRADHLRGAIFMLASVEKRFRATFYTHCTCAMHVR